jgi:hypothetical protein
MPIKPEPLKLPLSVGDCIAMRREPTGVMLSAQRSISHFKPLKKTRSFGGVYPERSRRASGRHYDTGL